MSEFAITNNKLERTREEIEKRLVEQLRKLSHQYPDVWIGYTGTLSKKRKDWVDLTILVKPKTKSEFRKTKEKEGITK